MEIVPKSIRAALLLPQDFSLYVKWQKQHLPSSDIGQIRNALEYYRFINYRNTQLSGNQPRSPPGLRRHVATECRHTIHPGDKIITELCPTCEVTAHMAFMHAITVAWRKAGGPSEARVRKKSYGQLCDGWHMARLQLQKLLEMFAITATYEQAWEAINPLEAAAAQKTRSASTAIKLAQMNCKYPARLSPPLLKVTSAKPKQQVRRVTFADEIQVKGMGDTFLAATVFTPERPQAFCYRGSPAYKPGIHACPPGSEYIDTSQTSSISANVNNLKIYVTDDEDAFDASIEKPHLYADDVGEHQGIVSLHKLKQVVFQFISDYMAQDGKAPEDLEEEVEEADRLLVFIDEDGNLFDLLLINGSTEEDAEGEDETGAGQDSTVWTCLRECLH